VCNGPVPQAETSTFLSYPSDVFTTTTYPVPTFQLRHPTFIMHNALAVLYSIFFLLNTCASALFLPQFRLAPSKPNHSELANKCSFTLWHKQLHTASTKKNYIQLNELQDHTNGIIIDIAALRPATSRNSYSRISAKQVFAIEGLLDNTNLTIRGEDGKNEVRCEHAGMSFSSDERKNSLDAWCVSGAWDNAVESSVGSRVRYLERPNCMGYSANNISRSARSNVHSPARRSMKMTTAVNCVESLPATGYCAFRLDQAADSTSDSQAYSPTSIRYSM
jgi:hypothetical protein